MALYTVADLKLIMDLKLNVTLSRVCYSDIVTCNTKITSVYSYNNPVLVNLLFNDNSEVSMLLKNISGYEYDKIKNRKLVRLMYKND